MERELLEDGGTDSVRASPPVRPSKSNVDGPASPVGVRGLGVEQEPMRSAFSSSLFLRQAAFGFK